MRLIYPVSSKFFLYYLPVYRQCALCTSTPLIELYLLLTQLALVGYPLLIRHD